MSEEPVIDPERQRQAREYNRTQRAWYIAAMGLTAAALLVFLASGLSSQLSRLIGQSISASWLVVLVYLVVVGVGYSLLFLPIRVYTGYALPKRYGLVVQGFDGWLVDRLKAGVIGGALAVLAVEVLYYLLAVFPDFWWLIGFGVSFAFGVLMAYAGPILIAPLLERYSPLEDAELRSRLERLAERAGAKISGVYTVHLGRKTTRANAAVTGIGRSRRIILVDTLFGKYSDDEIEVILAHELGHQVHRDIWRGMGVEAAVFFAGFLVADWALAAGAPIFGYAGMADIAGLPVLALVFLFVGFVSAPFVNWFSRWSEREADRFALRLTSDPSAFASMMAKLTGQNLGELQPPRWVKILFYSHPPPGERISYAEQYASGN